MLKIKLNSLSINNVIARFYLMMGVAFVLGFFELWTLAAFICVAMGASTIMGMSFIFVTTKSDKTIAGNIIQMDWTKGLSKAS